MKISDFEPFKLSSGAHKSPSEGMCVMEMVSFLAGEKWSEPEFKDYRKGDQVSQQRKGSIYGEGR